METDLSVKRLTKEENKTIVRTIVLPQRVIDILQGLVDQGIYQNRSEAFRTYVNRFLSQINEFNTVLNPNTFLELAVKHKKVFR